MPARLAIAVDRSAAAPLHRQIERSIREAIVAGQLPAGERLPSVRGLAAELGVARLTVLTAYDNLAADGWTRARTGIGTIVATRPDEIEPRDPLAPTAEPPVRAISTARPTLLGGWRSGLPMRRALTSVPRYDLRASGPAVPAITVGPAFERMLRDAWHDLSGGLAAGAADPAGDPVLRAEIAAHVRTTRGARCEPGQVIVVSGPLVGAAAAARLWLGPERRAFVDDPGEPRLRASLALTGADIEPLGSDDGGPLLEPGRGPASLLATSVSIRPFDGADVPLARRLRLLAWARAASAIVLEDARLEDLRLGPPIRSLQGLDEDRRVVHLGTFDGLLHGGLRMGYLVAPPDLVEPLLGTLGALDPGATPVQQRALARFLADGQLSRHLVRLRRALAERHEAALAAADRELGWLLRTAAPAGGPRLVLTIEDPSWTAAQVAVAAESTGVAIEPLAGWRAAPGFDRELLLDVSRHEPADLAAALRLIANAVRHGLAEPRTTHAYATAAALR
jgi:GntR family transcriptional regulator/MocR family aminotransferase